MSRRPYAGEVTKEYLEKIIGIEHVSTDGTEIIRNGKPVAITISDKTKKPYGVVTLDDPEIGIFTLGVHVLNYVWNGKTGIREKGMVIDHIDNDPTNNDISNLQMITQKENLAKDRTNWNIRELPCKLNKPRSFYEKKLEGYEMALEQAKEAGDAEGAHHLRTNVAQTKARLRYYDSHIAEALSIKEAKEAEEAKKREYHERAKKKKELQYRVDHTRKVYKELLEAYGKDDPIVEQYWGEWKLAIAMLHGFCAKNHSEASK